MFDDYLAINISNQYFSHRSEVVVDDIATLPRDIDPTGVLQKNAKDTFVHALDNMVHYYERIHSDEGVG